jgi:Xaa-Pro dipeptidase
MNIFSRAEFEQRLIHTKASMEEQGLEILLLADPANMNYLTGYDGWSFYTPQLVVVVLDEAEPFWIGRGMDANGARHTCYLAEDHIIGYPDNLVQTADNHPMRFVADFLKRHRWEQRSIGLEKDVYYFNARWLEELQQAIPNKDFLDCSLLVNWVRSIKSEAEIKYMMRAGKIAE